MKAPLIKDMETAVAGVLKISAELKTRSNPRPALVSILRKLRIARELSSVYYICVAGSQSAGKTRLVRELYELGEGWLADNQGRGERIPVFILEKDCDAPYAVVVKYDAQGNEKEEKISQDAFRALISGYDNSGDLDCLFPKLYVPRRYFDGQRCGFVLLPGYEMLNPDNVEWQGLMRHTLVHSLGSILVTDRTRVADNSQKQILNDLVARYFPDRKPAIAVTKTETLTPGQMDELAGTVAEVFQIRSDEQDRVIFTGVGDEAYRSAWTSQLIQVINKYALSAGGSDAGRLRELEKLLDTELATVKAALESELDAQSISEHITERQAERMREVFTKASERYRNRYAKRLREHTNSYLGQVRDIAEKKYNDEEEGFTNKFRHAANFLTLQSGENETRFRSRIIDCWCNGTSTLQSPLESDYLAISDMSAKELGIQEIKSSELAAIKHEGLNKLLGYEGASLEVPAVGTQEMQHDLRLLLSKGVTTTNEVSRFKAEHVEEVLKALPAMTMEYFRLNQAVAIRTPELARTELEAFDFGKLASSIQQDLPKVTASAKPLLNTLAAILAVDVVIDGSIDTIPAIAGTLTGGQTAAASLGASLSMAAAGAITLGFIAYRGATEIQRYDAARKGFIAESLNQFAEAHIKKGLELYDDLMETLEERLVRNLRVAYGLGADLTVKDALARGLTRLEHARVSLVKAIDDAQSRHVA